MDSHTSLAVKVRDAENIRGTALGGGCESSADGVSGELHVGLRNGEDAGDEEGDDGEGLHFERGVEFEFVGNDCESECVRWKVIFGMLVL